MPIMKKDPLTIYQEVNNFTIIFYALWIQDTPNLFLNEDVDYTNYLTKHTYKKS